jgi:hypothetical protein
LPVGVGVGDILIPGGASILFGILFEIDYLWTTTATRTTSSAAALPRIP